MNADFRLLGGADPWKVLGVARGAGQDEIKRAYRAKVRLTHPDAGGSHEEHTKVERALAILSDPVRLATYRALLDGPSSSRSSSSSGTGSSRTRPTDQSKRSASGSAQDFQWQSGLGPSSSRRKAPSDSSFQPYPSGGVYETRLAEQGRNTLAVISVPAAFLCGPVGLVLAIIALRQISKTGQRGAAWAWTAIVVTIGMTVVGIANTSGLGG